MKKSSFILCFMLIALFFGSCDKNKEPGLSNRYETVDSKRFSFALVNGMLHFKSIEKYEEFLSLVENEKERILSEFEKRGDFTSQREHKALLKSSSSIDIPLTMLLMTNFQNCILIENRVYKVNDEKGKVYSIHADFINNAEAMDDLVNEREESSFVQTNSVDEDIYEMSGLPITKGVINNNCPTWANGPSPKKDEASLYTGELYNSGIMNCDGYPGSRFPGGRERYYRGGILFSLFVEGIDDVSYVQGINSNCTDVTAYAEFIFKRRNTSGPAFWSSGSATGYSGRVKYTIYEGGNRLCYYKLNNGYIRFELLSPQGQNIGFINKYFSPNIHFNYN